MQWREEGQRFSLPVALPVERVPVWAVVLAAFIAVVPHFLPTFYVFLLIEMAIVALFATAFNLLMGYGGMVSFGHAAYFALGAYGAALLAKKAGFPMLLAFGGGPLVAAAGALLFGFFIVRLTAVYFAMLSLAFAQIVFTIIFKWYSFTGGDNGLLGIWPVSFLKAPIAYYYFTLVVVGLGLLALYAIVNSPFGYTLRAIRENPRRCRYIGVHVKRHQLLAFVLSGFFSGLAGALFAFFNGSVFPDLAFFNKSFEPLIVVLLGGMHAFLGPLAGAVGFKLLETFISRQWPVYWPLFMGAILVAAIMLTPKGFVGFLEQRPWRRWLWNKK
jgi:branched-chain amino acid transport system permease protein